MIKRNFRFLLAGLETASRPLPFRERQASGRVDALDGSLVQQQVREGARGESLMVKETETI